MQLIAAATDLYEKRYARTFRFEQTLFSGPSTVCQRLRSPVRTSPTSGLIS